MQTDLLMAISQAVMYAAGYVAIAYVLLFFNKKASDIYAHRRGFDVDDAIEEKSNLAVALRRAGLYLGIGIALYGVIAGPSYGFMKDIMLIAGYGAFVSVLFLGARIFNDFVILGKLDNTSEVQKGNIAVGFVECGGFIATGVIAMASVIGTGGGPTSAVVFFLIGQILLLLVTRAYEWVCRWNVSQEIANNNAAAGLLIGSLMVAFAVAVHGAIAIDFVSWNYNLMIFATQGLMAISFMMLLNLVADRVFLPGTSIRAEVVRDRNVAAIAVVSAVKIFGAILITAAVV